MCEDTNCEQIKCLNNQVFSKNASACPRTCANKEHHLTCNQEIEACACPEGKILDHNVFFFKHISISELTFKKKIF